MDHDGLHLSGNGPDQDRVVGGTTMQAYHRLRLAIVRGDLEPGATVSQVRLAAELGMSRSPLREALRLLQNEGLVRAEHQRRMKIAPLSAADLEEVYAIRLLAEPLAMRVTVKHLDDSELEAVAQANAESKSAITRRDNAAFHPPHRRFHTLLCSRAGPRLRRHIEDLWDQSRRYQQFTLLSGSGANAVMRLAAVDHDAILEAALQRDADSCAHLAVQHIARVGMSILAVLDGDRDPAILRAALNREAAPGDQSISLSTLTEPAPAS